MDVDGLLVSWLEVGTGLTVRRWNGNRAVAGAGGCRLSNGSLKQNMADMTGARPRTRRWKERILHQRRERSSMIVH